MRAWLKSYGAGFGLGWLVVGVIFYAIGSDTWWQLVPAVALGVWAGSSFYWLGAFDPERRHERTLTQP